MKLYKNDSAQHYWGWAFFKNEPWKFPIGMFNSLSYPNDVSIIFTDSIPLFAIIFKFILRLIRYTGEFQYFGFYGLLCFCLQSLFGMLITRKIINDNLIALIGGLFFCFSPFFIYRMFVHTALDSHYLILASICLILYSNILFRKSFKLNLFLVALISFLTSTIHMYLVVMCGIFIVSYSILYGLSKKMVSKPILLLLIFVIISLSSLSILGGFSSNVELGKVKKKYEIMPSIIQTTGYTNFKFMFNKCADKFGNFPKNDLQVRDDFSYLDLGIIVLSLFTLLNVGKMASRCNEQKIFLIIVIVYAFCFLVSLYPFLSLNGKIFFFDSINHNNFLLNIFRHNERLSLICSYIFFIFVLIILRSQKKLLPILFLCLCLQVIDKPISLAIEKKSNDSIILRTPTIGKLIIVERFQNPRNIIYVIKKCQFAYDNNFKLTNFYFARPLEKEYDYFNYKIKHPEKGDFFIFELDSDNYKKLNCSSLQKSEHNIFCQI